MRRFALSPQKPFKQTKGGSSIGVACCDDVFLCHAVSSLPLVKGGANAWTQSWKVFSVVSVIEKKFDGLWRRLKPVAMNIKVTSAQHLKVKSGTTRRSRRLLCRRCTIVAWSNHTFFTVRNQEYVMSMNGFLNVSSVHSLSKRFCGRTSVCSRFVDLLTVYILMYSPLPVVVTLESV